MLRTFLLFLFLTIYSNFTFSQKDTSDADGTLLLSFSVGIALPLFDYNHTQIKATSDEYYVGDANPGFNSRVNLNWFIFRKTGFSFDAVATYNNANGPAFSTETQNTGYGSSTYGGKKQPSSSSKS